MSLLIHSYFMSLRLVLQLVRQPWWIVFTLVQPVIWLVFSGQVFERMADLPGFTAGSYIEYLTPGIVVMSALFSSGWSGMGIIEDLENGVMERFLVSPASRFSIIAGRICHTALTNIVQSLILFGLGFILGARYAGGIQGLLILLLSAILLGLSFGSLSNGWALTVRRPDSVIAVTNILLLPLTYLSPVFVSNNLLPKWIQTVSSFNPVAWSTEAGREALAAAPDWNFVLLRITALATFAAISMYLATAAFRNYQRSI